MDLAVVRRRAGPPGPGRPTGRAASPVPAPDQLLVRNDAAGLCFSDVKIIQLGSQHPRLTGHDLAARPLVPGHEVSLTVVGLGARLAGRFATGQRFAVQPDVWYGGLSQPYGYVHDGGFQQYGLIGREIWGGDAGSYLVPVPPELSYAGAALTEPWACVEASYRATYRTTLRPGGRAWFLGRPAGRSGYRLDALWPPVAPPGQVVLTRVPADLAGRLAELARAGGVELVEVDLAEARGAEPPFDDIVILDGDASLIDAAASRLASGGVLAIASPGPLDRPIQVDLGRLHYDGIVHVGTTGTDLDAAYRQTPVRADLRPGGVTWVVGAGGPMGRMHVQRAIESPAGPRRILATQSGSARARDLAETFAASARQRGVELLVAGPAEAASLLAASAAEGGIDDVQLMVAAPDLVAEAAGYLAPGGVINLFAGLKRGVTAPIDAWLIYGPRQIRLIGHSGSGLDDQAAIIERAAAGQLAPERSLVAIGGLRQLPEALQALIDATFSGKIVLFPLVLDFPLTPLAGLKPLLPRVYDCLGPGHTWTAAAEAAFLEAMLK